MKFIALSTHTKKFKEGIEPISLNMADSMQTMCDKTFNKNDIVIGHSMGASIALMIAKKTPPKELHLYSPSLIFTETVSLLDEENLKYFGVKIKEVEPIPKVDCPVFVYVGSNEASTMIDSAKIVAKHLGSTLEIIPNANHMSVVNKYLKAV